MNKKIHIKINGQDIFANTKIEMDKDGVLLIDGEENFIFGAVNITVEKGNIISSEPLQIIP